MLPIVLTGVPSKELGEDASALLTIHYSKKGRLVLSMWTTKSDDDKIILNRCIKKGTVPNGLTDIGCMKEMADFFKFLENETKRTDAGKKLIIEAEKQASEDMNEVEENLEENTSGNNSTTGKSKNLLEKESNETVKTDSNQGLNQDENNPLNLEIGEHVCFSLPDDSEEKDYGKIIALCDNPAMCMFLIDGEPDNEAFEVYFAYLTRVPKSE